MRRNDYLEPAVSRRTVNTRGNDQLAAVAVAELAFAFWQSEDSKFTLVDRDNDGVIDAGEVCVPSEL